MSEEKKERIIKQIKLVTDEVIIAELVNRSGDVIKLKMPLLVIVNRYQQSGAYYIGDWIPMCKDEIMPLSFKDIITIVEPEDHLRDMWIEMTSIKPVTKENDINLH